MIYFSSHFEDSFFGLNYNPLLQMRVTGKKAKCFKLNLLLTKFKKKSIEIQRLKFSFKTPQLFIAQWDTFLKKTYTAINISVIYISHFSHLFRNIRIVRLF